MQNTVDLWSFIYISYKSKSINSAISWGFVDFYKYENQSLKSERNRCQMLWIFDNMKIKVQNVKVTVGNMLLICGFSKFTHFKVLLVKNH